MLIVINILTNLKLMKNLVKIYFILKINSWVYFKSRFLHFNKFINKIEFDSSNTVHAYTMLIARLWNYLK